MDQKFYICRHCGNIITMIRDCGVPISCCGEKMQEVRPGTTDAAEEKHVPVYERCGDQVSVTVGAVPHPMTPEHYIEWICLLTQKGLQLKKLEPTDQPSACFSLCEGETVEAALAFCNLHSLWKS